MTGDSDPETELGKLGAAERRLWQNFERARKEGASSEVLREIVKAASETGENRRDLWRRTYEESPAPKRKP